VPPQLATAELETLRRRLDQYSTYGSLRFAISRFDEAGVDPTGDRSAYDELAQSKVRELRQAFELSDHVPVSVVAPDPWQMAGEQLQPYPAVWDDCRSWDGIAELRRELESLPARAAALREAATIRYWKGAVRNATDNIAKHYDLARSSFETAIQARKRTGQLVERLNELEEAVSSDLDGVLESILDQALRAGIADSARLRERTVDALRDWYGRSSAKLALLVQDGGIQMEHQMSRPGWRDFEELLRGELPSPDTSNRTTTGDDAGPSDAFSARLRQLNNSLAKSMQEVKAVFGKSTKDFSREGSVPSLAPPPGVPRAVIAGEVLVALGPALVDMFTLVTDIWRERNEQRAEERKFEAIELEVAELQKSFTEKAFSMFAGDIEAVRLALSETSQSLVDLVAALGERVQR